MKIIIITLALVVVASGAIPSTKLIKNGVHYKRMLVHPIKFQQGTAVHPRIINGDEAVPHSIPYQAFLTFTGPQGSWLCGGSLISEKYVLTAGHCGDGATSVDVLLGAHDIITTEDTQVRVTATKITVHDDWNESTITDDICLIELDEPVELTEAIQVVKLPSRSDASELYENQPCKVSGWGLTDGFGNSVSPVLNYAESTILSNKQCRQYFNILVDSEICMSGDDEKSACNGDSGGPLTVEGVQVGIVSYGIMWCLPGYPSAFTRVTSYLDWIQNNTNIVIN